MSSIRTRCGALRPARAGRVRRRLAPSVGLAALLLVGFEAGSARAQTLFEFRGEAFAEHHLSEKLQRLVYQVEAERHAALSQLVDEALFELYLDERSAQTGDSRAEIARQALAVDEPTDDDIERFYALNRQRIGASLEASRERIARHLKRGALGQRKNALVSEFKASGDFRLALAVPPPPPVDFDVAGVPVRGRVGAPVTIVEFGDYQCPRCRSASAVLKRVVERYPDDVRMIYLDFPVNRSGISRRVAEGAVCADRQRRYWSYHDLAFARQQTLDQDAPQALARELGLDLDIFATCLDDPGVAATVRRAERQARDLGLLQTPGIFVNGRPLPAGHLERELDAAIGRLLRSRRP